MNPYQTLANAIVQQAAVDHRKSVSFLKAHPHTDELDDIVEAQVKERKARIKKRREDGLPSMKEKPTAEEKLLSRILYAEDLLEDSERFFKSDWFRDLTDLDGFLLLRRLKEMEDEEDGCEGVSGAGE